VLDEAQRRRVYNEHMKEDFPPSELKSLELIEQGIAEGYYRFLGLLDHNEVIGYVCLVEAGDACLIDYLAVVPGRRSSGAGSELLRLLENRLKDKEYVIIEAELPDSGRDADETALRKRRVEFYLRNGILDTGIDVRCFGVDFRILEAGTHDPHQRQDVIRRYENVYRRILPEKLFRDNIHTD
jgi:GNAT superfamily N-acetyltransferase